MGPKDRVQGDCWGLPEGQKDKGTVLARVALAVDQYLLNGYVNE